MLGPPGIKDSSPDLRSVHIEICPSVSNFLPSIKSSSVLRNVGLSLHRPPPSAHLHPFPHFYLFRTCAPDRTRINRSCLTARHQSIPQRQPLACKTRIPAFPRVAAFLSQSCICPRACSQPRTGASKNRTDARRQHQDDQRRLQSPPLPFWYQRQDLHSAARYQRNHSGRRVD